jgi:endonuclease G
MDIPASFQFGEPIHESPNEYEECFILSRKAYKVYYCAELKISLWSAYAFRPTDHTSPRCERCFKEDPEYKMDPGKYPRMVHYANTYRKDLKGFDKGHQAPDAGLKVYGDAEQRETYYLSNMTPQYSLTNQGIWREWEDKVRQMATSEEPVWVITGPVLYKDREAKRLKGDSTGPVIPHGYFMIATRGWDEPDAVAILVENTDVRLSWRDNYKATLTTVDHIEELTGFDFLAELPDSVENVLEATPQDLWE